jgi:hypothetical protein
MSADTREMLEILLALSPWLVFIGFLIWSSARAVFERSDLPAERAEGRSSSARKDREPARGRW